jgi:hypothetical protein
MMQDRQTWFDVAEAQNNLAMRYAIVNQFNAMIALETEQQLQDLQKYEKQDDRYNAG